MTAFKSDTVLGKLAVQSVPERACFTTWDDFIQALPTFLQVQVPASVTNVLVGSDAPTDDDTSNVWFRTDLSGGFLGIYFFTSGAWRKVYPFDSNMVIWQIGDSTVIPDGFEVITSTTEDIPVVVRNAIISQYVPSATPNVFNYFAMRFVGY